MSKNICFVPSFLVFVLNFSSIHLSSLSLIHLYEDVVLTFSLTFLGISSLDGGRDSQQGFQENKDEGASHRCLPGLCQRKQGCVGECVTAWHKHTHTHTHTHIKPHAFHSSTKRRVLGNFYLQIMCTNTIYLSALCWKYNLFNVWLCSDSTGLSFVQYVILFNADWYDLKGYMAVRNVGKSLFSFFNFYFFFTLQKCYLSRLEEIRDTLETSAFFKAHEVKTYSRSTNPTQ